MKFLVFLLGILSVSLSSCSTNSHLKTSIEEALISFPEYKGEYEGFSLLLDERFNDFNNAVWRKGDGAVGGESVCRFQENGVRIVDGVMELEVRKEQVQPSWSEDHQQDKGVYDFSCGEFRTIESKKIRYGRIEVRMKAPAREKASGYISSLFTYTNDFDRNGSEADKTEWEEIDIELEGSRPDKFQANLIYGENTWEWSRTRDFGAWEDKIIVGPVDEWRVYAIEWLPDAIKWYIDGKLVKTLFQSVIDCKPECVFPQKKPTPIPDNPTDIIINFWIPNDAIQDVFGGNKRGNVYPMVTQYDWLRYYQLDSHPMKSW